MRLRPIYYDTETTGVRSDKDRIVEIAAFDPEKNLSFVRLVNPEMAIPKEATAIHKISDEMVKEASTFRTVGEEFRDFCEGAVVLIAHNNDSFDKLFLENEYRRAALELPNFPFIDSLKWSRKYRSDLPRHTLQFLRELYGITANQAHRALDDVMVLYQVFSYMIDDLSMENVLELLSKKVTLSHMPFGKYQGKSFVEVPKSYVQWLKSSGALDKSENKELLVHFEKLGYLS